MIAVADPFSRPRLAPPDSVELRGPADADHFRVKVGRYGDRWYTDPLDGDHIAGASDATFPSVSTCKKASGSDWSFVALKRVATAMDTEKYAKLAQWPWGDRYEALKAINKLGLNGAAQRGTNVHLMAEARLYGRPDVVGQGDPGWEYRGAVDQFFDQYQPTLVAAEFVCIHRTLNGAGYGGTADAIIEIDGELWFVDWKSRSVDSDHGAYPEEAAQIGGYWGSQYIIAEGVNGPERRAMPQVKGGLIVSIKPDGCRVYPVDLDKGFTHWTALHAWWVARQEERAPVGRPLAPRKALQDVGEASERPRSRRGAPSTHLVAGSEELSVAPPTPGPATPVAGEVERAARTPSPALGYNPTPDNPLGLPPGVTMGEMLAAADPRDRPHMEESNRKLRLAIVDARATLATNPEQGADLSDETAFGSLWAKVRTAYDALDPASRSWIADLSAKATRQGLTFHTVNCRTERSYEIARGLVALATAEADSDEILRALLALVIGDVALFAGVHPGHALGSLNATEAHRFAELVDTFNGPGLAAWIDHDGTFRLREMSPA